MLKRDGNRAARRHTAAQHLARHSILHRFLHHTAHWASTKPWIIATFDEKELRIILYRDRDLLLGERGIDPLEDEVEHLHQFFLSKRPEEDDFVKAVEELGTELTTVNELVGKLLLELLKLVTMLDIFADRGRPQRYSWQ